MNLAHFYVVRVFKHRPSGMNRFKYMTACGAWSSSFEQAKGFADRWKALIERGNRNGAVYRGSEIIDTVYYRAEQGAK